MSDLDPTPASLESPPRRSGWWGHLLILGSYPMVVGLLGVFLVEGRGKAILSPNAWILLATVGYELGFFALILAAACRVSRVSATQLYLPWGGGLLPLLRGAGYSVALRVLVAIVTVGLLLVYALFNQFNLESIQNLRPKVEVLVDTGAMASDPVYLWLNLTVVSFIMAGLREELWRAGMLAALRALWPERFQSRLGGLVAVAIIAVAFGLGHAPQGWGAVGLTTLLGFGLGAIMVWHRSIWDAVFAHGFFDATSFAMLWYITRNYPNLLTGS